MSCSGGYFKLNFLVGLLCGCLTSAADLTNADYTTLRSIDGSEIEARVLSEEHGFIIIERREDGQSFHVDPARFQPDDLKKIREIIARSEAVPTYPERDKVNGVLGIDLFPATGSLWEIPAASVAESLEMQPESRDSSLQSYATPHGKQKEILGENCHQIRLFAEDGLPERFTFIFDNRAAREVADQLANMSRELRLERQRMEGLLKQVLGEGRVRSMFRGGGFTEHGRLWQIGDSAIVLSHSDSYVALRIMPLEIAENAGRAERITSRNLREWTLANVDRLDNGDVLIRNIPMTDQGPYGFCVPATFERYLRYLKIPADMHLLAMHANSSAVSGTSMRALVETTGNYVSANQRRLREASAQFFTPSFFEIIDEGRPIAWTMTTTESFNNAANQYTSLRASGSQAEIRQLRQSATVEKDENNAHVLLITGYNRDHQELRISDSWGFQLEERWIPLEWANRVSLGRFYLIDI